MFNYFLVRTAQDEMAASPSSATRFQSRATLAIPGDISSAAFWLVAAAAQPRGHLLVRGVGLNDTRTAFLGV